MTERRGLKRELGLFQVISYITGGIIGVGIFVSPSAVLQGSGSSLGVSLIVWISCAVISYFGALCYAELGILVPKSGGTYTYVREAFGDVLGFMCCWAHLVLVRPLASVVASLAAAEYFLRPFFLFCPELIPPKATKLLACAVLCITIMANSASVKIASKLQILSTICKLLALATIIIVGIIYLAQGNYENLAHPFKTENLTPGGFVMAFYAGWYAFMGWDNGNTGIEEIKNPRRVLPLAILIGLTIPTVVYLLAIVAYHVVLSNDDILSGVAVAVVFGERGIGFAAKWMIVPCIGISASGIVNAIAFVSSRYNFVAGRDRLLPRFLGMVNVKRKTPEPSLYAMLFFAVAYLAMSDFATIIGSYSFIKAIGEALAILGLFRIRKKYGTSPDVYKTPWPFPVIYVGFFLVVSSTAFIYKTRDMLIPVIITLIGLPIYFLAQSKSWKSGKPMAVNNFITSLCQKLLLCDFSTDEINNE